MEYELNVRLAIQSVNAKVGNNLEVDSRSLLHQRIQETLQRDRDLYTAWPPAKSSRTSILLMLYSKVMCAPANQNHLQ